MREFLDRLYRKIYLWQNQLNILPAERQVITILLAILIIMMAVWAVLPPQKTLYDQKDYAQLHQLFREKSEQQKKQYERIAQRYNPSERKQESTAMAGSEQNEEDKHEPLAVSTEKVSRSKKASQSKNKKISSAGEKSKKSSGQSIAKKSETNSPPLSKESPTLLPLNAATQEQLIQLPGIGPVIAGRIVEYRRNNGYFIQLKQLKEIKGIGPARFDKIRSLVTITDKN